MSTPVENMSETQLILELVLTLFDMPETAPEMTDEDAMRCGTAAYELLAQYLRKLTTGATPELTAGTREFIARVGAREFEPTTH